MIDRLDLKSSNPISPMLIPSMTILPEDNSTNRNKTAPRDDLPTLHIRRRKRKGFNFLGCFVKIGNLTTTIHIQCIKIKYNKYIKA